MSLAHSPATAPAQVGSAFTLILGFFKIIKSVQVRKEDKERTGKTAASPPAPAESSSPARLLWRQAVSSRSRRSMTVSPFGTCCFRCCCWWPATLSTAS